MARPIKHQVSELISEGRTAEARVIVERAVHEAGSVAGGAKRLGASSSAMWRWVVALGVASLYDGRSGAETRWARERAKRTILDEIL